MAMFLTGTIAIGLPAGASAHTGEFAKFNFCPSHTAGVAHCVYSVTNKGTVVLGKKTTPIVNPVTLQGGYAEENEETHIAQFYGASGAETLSKTPQPVPGGLAGIVPPESAPPIVKEALKFFFENGLTGVNATLELAKPASEIQISSFNLLVEEGIALKLPVKVHLENPFLGSKCYVGSSTTPIIWNLITGTTSPSAPNTPITGKPGFTELKEEFRIAEITENELVDNAWGAPKATGCGGFLLELLVDPIINEVSLGNLSAGHNTALLENTIDSATATAVNNH
ncbi:MAG TPA: hypothetical protein VGI76_07560 [Solirubrobacteraceae bacterium]|jgi:hypothetical protein